MIIDKSGINEEDKFIAQRTLNLLRLGERLFGNPAEGLKITLKKMEEEMSSVEKSKTEFAISDKESKKDLNKLKAGIKGEEKTAEYIEKILKHDERLDGVVVFASLSFEPNDKLEEVGHIPDTDFVAVCGNSILIIDSKNISTNKENPIFLQDGALRSMTGVLLENVSSSTYFWRKKLPELGITPDSIEEIMCIYNTYGASILKNQDWHSSPIKPIHISGLLDHLIEWKERVDDKVSLKMLTAFCKAQIKKPKSTMDLKSAFNKFKI